MANLEELTAVALHQRRHELDNLKLYCSRQHSSALEKLQLAELDVAANAKMIATLNEDIEGVEQRLFWLKAQSMGDEGDAL